MYKEWSNTLLKVSHGDYQHLSKSANKQQKQNKDMVLGAPRIGIENTLRNAYNDPLLSDAWGAAPSENTNLARKRLQLPPALLCFDWSRTQTYRTPTAYGGGAIRLGTRPAEATSER